MSHTHKALLGLVVVIAVGGIAHYMIANQDTSELDVAEFTPRATSEASPAEDSDATTPAAEPQNTTAPAAETAPAVETAPAETGASSASVEDTLSELDSIFAEDDIDDSELASDIADTSADDGLTGSYEF